MGMYTAWELLQKGVAVEIICMEDHVSDHELLTFYKERVDAAFLESFLQDKHYDGIVNFIHYQYVEDYPPVHKLLTEHTDHLIVLSSYRVYADEQHPVTESAPMLLDISTDRKFVETEKYAISKAKLEKYLYSECLGQNWTVVRPVISFSQRRFDLITYTGHSLFEMTARGEEILLPIEAKALIAGFDWAGNSGKQIANLLFKKETIGQAYTVSSAQNLTWEQVAQCYTDTMGAKFKWVPLDEFLEATNRFNWYGLAYDRLFDRTIDNSKILNATGLAEKDFLSVKEGMKIEIALLKGEK